MNDGEIPVNGTKDNVVPFEPVKEREKKRIGDGGPMPPPSKYQRGEWVRYYGQDGRLSIAQVEYIMADVDTIYLTDRGLVRESLIVESRKSASNV